MATVRFLILPFSRHPSRRSTAGGEFRLGTISMYMATYTGLHASHVDRKIHSYMGIFSRQHNIIMSPKSPAWDDLVAEITGNFGLGTDTPERRSIQPAGAGKNVAFPQVGGLHHRYQRLAA
ncbi:MAG: hypothetical protein J4G15_09335 [Alphaproteobacteria bacterium]|nr:hypothetical protein [Alphaproteobacteria bacterium]